MPGETTSIDAIHTNDTSDTSDAQLAQVAELVQRAERAGITLRNLPPKPLTCCGRGCNGCVWEGYFTALDHWCEDAIARLG